MQMFAMDEKENEFFKWRMYTLDFTLQTKRE